MAMLVFSPTKTLLEQLPRLRRGREYIRITDPGGFVIEEVETSTGTVISQVMRGRLEDLSPADFDDLNRRVRV